MKKISKENKEKLLKENDSNLLKNKKEKFIKIKNEQTLQFSETMWNIMSILLLELSNIKNSLVNSSRDIEKIFKFPLSHLKKNVIF